MEITMWFSCIAIGIPSTLGIKYGRMMEGNAAGSGSFREQ
jgi:hypothetical protein